MGLCHQASWLKKNWVIGNIKTCKILKEIKLSSFLIDNRNVNIIQEAPSLKAKQLVFLRSRYSFAKVMRYYHYSVIKYSLFSSNTIINFLKKENWSLPLTFRVKVKEFSPEAFEAIHL